ncbi:MAG TPA: HK97 family phage prohead protease [Stellaceae bacterium]|nr:HK97 family phage prohead protease [Stellaceae bacterium]
MCAIATMNAGASTDRNVTFRLSDNSVARDGCTIATSGWDLANYRKNPVVLFSHDAEQPPVGRTSLIYTSGDALYGTVTFADAETYPFADTIFRLVKGLFLNAVSVAWLPIEWKYSTDRSRQGGIDFLKQELLEISVVPIPAAPDAIATARAAGIDISGIERFGRELLAGDLQVQLPASEEGALRRAFRAAGIRATAGGRDTGRAARAAEAARLKQEHERQEAELQRRGAARARTGNDPGTAARKAEAARLKQEHEEAERRRVASEDARAGRRPGCF